MTIWTAISLSAFATALIGLWRARHLPGIARLGLAGLLAVGLAGSGLMLWRASKPPSPGAAASGQGRPSQIDAEAARPARPPLPELNAADLAMIAELRDTVARRPDDVRGLALLARNEAARGDFTAAYAAQARMLELKDDNATAREFTDYATMLILAAGGYVSPRAETALRAALERDPLDGQARYYLGLMMNQTGQDAAAFRIWDRLLRESPADAPWAGQIRARIGAVAERAAANFSPPPSRPSPNRLARGAPPAEGADARADTGADTLATMRGMLTDMEDRLTTAGGPPQDWARLITALGALGESAGARRLYDSAQARFSDDAAALDMIRAGARQAGVIR